MAAQTIVAAGEFRPIGFLGVQAVENRALLGIDGRQLQHLAILHKTNGGVVVEINGARRARRDVRGLNAGARKHQHLRIDVDVQLLQDGGQVSPAVRRVVEFDFPALELLFKLRDRVGNGTRVLNGRIVQGNVEGIFQSIRRKPLRLPPARPSHKPAQHASSCYVYRLHAISCPKTASSPRAAECMIEAVVELNREICRTARLSRDARFDGKFFIAVRTTRIFCRPVCPARSPKEENIDYYPSAAAALQAGFRPCLRCRPESWGTAAWDGTSTTVVRALRLIDEGALDLPGDSDGEDSHVEASRRAPGYRIAASAPLVLAASGSHAHRRRASAAPALRQETD